MLSNSPALFDSCIPGTCILGLFTWSSPTSGSSIILDSELLLFYIVLCGGLFCACLNLLVGSYSLPVSLLGSLIVHMPLGKTWVISFLALVLALLCISCSQCPTLTDCFIKGPMLPRVAAVIPFIRFCGILISFLTIILSLSALLTSSDWSLDEAFLHFPWYHTFQASFHFLCCFLTLQRYFFLFIIETSQIYIACCFLGLLWS